MSAIVVFRVDRNNYLGRVMAVEKEVGRLTIGRKKVMNREVAFGEVLGCGALNTR